MKKHHDLWASTQNMVRSIPKECTFHQLHFFTLNTQKKEKAADGPRNNDYQDLFLALPTGLATSCICLFAVAIHFY